MPTFQKLTKANIGGGSEKVWQHRKGATVYYHHYYYYDDDYIGPIITLNLKMREGPETWCSFGKKYKSY